MVNDSQRIVVTCGHCQRPIEQELGWFRTHNTFVHEACGRIVHCDYNEFVKILSKKAGHADGKLVAEPEDIK
jgi:hypothetical protein